MGTKVTFVAEHKGQTFTRTATTGRTYTHVALVFSAEHGGVIDFRWSMSAKAAAARLPHGWENRRVAVVECFPEGQTPVAEQPAPVAEPVEVELCASNSNAKVMHYRAVGTQVTLCLKATTSRKPNARQLADAKVCTGCTTGHQG